MPDIYLPSQPRHLKITQTMIDDFMIDPVLGIQIIFGAKLDHFQRCRAKICWWTPRVMDSSGFSSAKTISMWFISNLRCILIPNHVAAVYYPSFESGKKIYWNYFRDIALRAPLFRAQMGMERVEGLDGSTSKDAKAMDRSASCYEFRYRNESKVLMPAPGFMQGAKSQAGYRFNDLYIDEWTKVEAGGKGEGIDDQLVGRTTRACFNKEHPIFCNHHLFLATAEDTMHPAYERYKSYLKECRQGNPDYFVFAFNFKDYSDAPFNANETFKYRFREDRAIHDLRRKGKSGYLQEALGFWSKNGTGWYSGLVIDRCYELGKQWKSAIYTNRAEDPEGGRAYYFLGVDPARAASDKADDGAMVVLRAVPIGNQLCPTDTRAYKLSFCYAHLVRKADARQWAAIIHRKHQHFGFTGICMDGGGGGIWVQPELAKTEQLIRGTNTICWPIASLEDEENTLVAADFILSMFRPGDPSIKRTWSNVPNLKFESLTEIAHIEFRDGLTQGIAFPQPYTSWPRTEVEKWSDEKRCAIELVSGLKRGIGTQLMQIFVVLDDQGQVLLSKQTQSKKFASKSRKDFAYAAMYAYMKFKMWVATGAEEIHISDEDAEMCCSA